MQEFRVWAPYAHQIELDAGGRRIEMQSGADGWWRVEAAGVRDYGFVVDGGETLPDPRSGWQPQGVHGRSRVVDHNSFRWSDAGWQQRPLAAAVFYELHIGTFTPAGTFESAIARLPDLVRLGITHVELMPVAHFAGERGWGYDGVHPFAPHHAYGGPEGLKRLVNACHRLGLAVVLDVVYNHLGPSGNYLPRFGPYFTEKHHTPWGAAVNFDDAGSPEVRRYFLDNAAMWLRDYHIDGLRVDAVHAIVDTSALHFMEELVNRVRALEAELGRHLVVIAESDLNDPRVITEPALGGWGCDAQWSDDFHHALHALLTGERGAYYADFGGMEHLARALENGYVYGGEYSVFRRRAHGRPARHLPRSRFLGYLQNHDQVGNRATGDRSSALLSLGRLQIGAATVLLSPFVPMLFQGEEWGASTPFAYFTDHDDPDLGRAVSEGRRREFSGWTQAEVPDPQARTTFERSQLNWEERRRSPHSDLLAWHQELIRLRQTVTEVRTASTAVTCDVSTGVFRIERGPVTVVFHLGPEPVEIAEPAAHALLLASSREVRLSGAGLRLAPDSVAVTANISHPQVRDFLTAREGAMVT